MRNEAVEACLEVIKPLEELGVDYFVGGSLATSAHGIPRSTNDADLVADLRLAHVIPFVAALEGRFYVDADRVRHAVHRKSSFNVIFLETIFKVDIFILKDDPLWREEMRRRESLVLTEGGRAVDIASAEDMILQKLGWYEAGNRIADRQWQDLLGVLKVRGSQLDYGYLKRWAPEVQVEELLEKALLESGLTEV